VLLVSSAADGSPPADPRATTDLEGALDRWQPTEEELEDLRFIAEDEGITLAEAIERIAWQPRFGVFVDRLRSSFPDDFAGARIIDGGRFNAFVQFRGSVPEGVATDASIRGLSIDFRTGVGFSERDLATRARTVHRSLLMAGFADTVTGYDISSGTIDVEIARRPEDRGRSTEAMLTLLPRSARADGVRVAFFDSLPGNVDTVYGGGSAGSSRWW